MNSRFSALGLGSLLALALGFLVTNPVMADEWDKKTEFQFNAPVEIPGKVLAPGKYVFELADSDSDRNIVQVFSEDAKGHQSLVATVFAIPDELSETPDKPIIHFEERPAGTPEAIHSWYYPGENTGWAFVYLKGQDVQTSANTTPAPAAVTASAPVLAAASPGLPRAPKVPEAGPVPEVVTMDEEILVAQSNAPAPPAAQEADGQGSADRILPETGGHSGLEIVTGLAMLGGGFAAVFAPRRKPLA